MEESIQLSPTPQILHACNLVEQALRRFLAARDSIPSWGTYEAQDEAHLMLLHSYRCIEAILVLAREDLVLLPAAMGLARTVMETSLRVAWLLQPRDLMECEARWLTLIAEEAATYAKGAALFKIRDPNGSKRLGELHSLVKKFHDDVRDELQKRQPNKYQIPKNTPDVASLFRTLSVEEGYWFYRYLSQFTHGTTIANRYLRRGYGTMKMFGEDIPMLDWQMCLRFSWQMFSSTSYNFLAKYGGDVADFSSPNHESEIQAAFAAIT